MAGTGGPIVVPDLRESVYLYSMRVCLWHGWLLEGSGSNVYTAKIT